MTRGRVARLVFLAGALAVALVLGRKWPKDQTVHYVLGAGAAHVEQIDAAWAADTREVRSAGGGTAGGSERTSDSEEPILDVSYRYPVGEAPRVITHEPRLPDGDYTVKIEIVGDRGRAVVLRHVTLNGAGALSIDLATAAEDAARTPTPGNAP